MRRSFMWPKKLTVKPHEVCSSLFQLTHHPCFSVRHVYTLREYIIHVNISLKLNQALYTREVNGTRGSVYDRSLLMHQRAE